MNRFSDESQLRELFKRLKQSDERNVPLFDDVVTRPLRRSARTVNRFQLSGACLAVAALFAVCFFLRSQSDDSAIEIVSPVLEKNAASIEAVVSHSEAARSDRPVDLDYDGMRRSLDDYFVAATTQDRTDLSLWSSRTDSLLSLNLNQPFVKE